MKKVRQLALAGCWELDLFQYLDDRGVFVKPWDKSFLDESGLSFEMRECFWSISPRGSIRGMHFQQPPHANSNCYNFLLNTSLPSSQKKRRGSSNMQWNISAEPVPYVNSPQRFQYNNSPSSPI